MTGLCSRKWFGDPQPKCADKPHMELNEKMRVLPGTSLGEYYYFVAAWHTGRPHHRFVAVARHLIDAVFVANPGEEHRWRK